MVTTALACARVHLGPGGALGPVAGAGALQRLLGLRNGPGDRGDPAGAAPLLEAEAAPGLPGAA